MCAIQIDKCVIVFNQLDQGYFWATLLFQHVQALCLLFAVWNGFQQHDCCLWAFIALWIVTYYLLLFLICAHIQQPPPSIPLVLLPTFLSFLYPANKKWPLNKQKILWTHFFYKHIFSTHVLPTFVKRWNYHISNLLIIPFPPKIIYSF